MRRVMGILLAGMLIFGAFPAAAADFDGGNVAADKPVFGNVCQEGYEAWRAVDGDADTCYRAKPIGQKNRVYRLAVDLGGECAVRKIRVQPPAGDPEALRDVVVYGTSDASFAEKTRLSALAMPEDGMNDIALEAPAAFRYIVLEKPTTGAAAFGVAELEVYADTPASAGYGRMVKISENRVASGTPGYGPMNGKHQTLFDGDDTTGWASTNAGSVAWVFVDLEGEYEIPYVTLSSGGGSGGQLRYRKDLRIVAANDMDDIKNNAADVLSVHEGILAPDLAGKNTDLCLFVTDEAYAGKKYRYVGVSREPTLSTNGGNAMESYMDVDELCIYTPAVSMQTDYTAVSAVKMDGNVQISGYGLSGGEESGTAILGVYDADGAFLGAAMQAFDLHLYGQTGIRCNMDLSGLANADAIATGTLAFVQSAEDLSVKKLIRDVWNTATSAERPQKAASGGKASLAFSDKTLDVTGTTAAQSVFALVRSPEEAGFSESVLYAGECRPDENGAFHIACPLPQTPLPGTYTVQLGYDVGGSADTRSIYCASKEEEADLIAALQTVTADTFMEVFRQYRQLFADLEQDVEASADTIGESYLLAADAIARGLVSDELTTLQSGDDVSAAIATALVIDAARHNGPFAAQVAAYGGQMPLVFGNDYNADRFAAVLPAANRASAVTDGASAAMLLRRIAALSLIYEGSYTERAAALEQYRDALGISSNAIPSDVSTLSVAKKIGNTMTDVERYAAGMDGIVRGIAAELKPKKPTGGGSSGGHSSKGGGTGGKIGTVTVPPVEPITQKPAEPTKPESPVFTDIADIAWAKDAIQILAARNIVAGNAAGAFEPGRAVTREEAVKMLALAAGISSKGTAVQFTDCAADGWYVPYLAAAADAGLITGKDDGSFGLKEHLTRQDLAVLVYRALKDKVELSKSAAVEFSDTAEVSDYAKEAVTALAALELITGMPDGSFAPKETVTRAQAAVVMERMLAKLEGAGQ